MNGLRAVFVKELNEYFATPIALAVVAVFWALCGYLFSFNLFFVNTAQMVTSFHNMIILMILVMPLLTMRIFAEENKTGTIELLLTLPLNDVATVLGKFFAGLFVLFLMVAGTATAVIPLVFYGNPDFGPILGGYVGTFLFGAMFLAIGLAVSSACSNQVVAALITWGILVLLWFIDYPAALNFIPALSAFFLHLSLSAHHVDLIRGVLSGGALVYFCSVILFSLLVAVQVLKLRRLR
ncbi:MAG: ABC transporter permease subunit [Alcaligenaceae bacterium]|nr:ABC transporter permease subunit [Alcaligenaceae bacterium]